MALRFDNVVGRILIDEDACHRDIGYAREAISYLENANAKLKGMEAGSATSFVGRAGDRFRAALNTAMRRNTDEINNLNQLINVIQAAINRYQNADSSLAARFRRS
jgi:uncharacterized protein YukE